MDTQAARELADRLARIGRMTQYRTTVDAARVLREQADEIDRLNAEVGRILNVLADHPDAVMRNAVADVLDRQVD